MNYCTLFNSRYLSRGIALYNSLLKNTKSFHLIIFAFDDITFQILTKMQLECVSVISLKDFETQALLQVKKTRTVGEYCWTCTPFIIQYCLSQFSLEQVCYLDADLYFWGDPAELLSELKQNSILITEHRYSPEYNNPAAGKYCVQFMLFKNNEKGLAALNWWADACLAWCYDRVEPGRFGDQKYLDDWLTRFEGVKVLQHLGGGVAPWNVQQYDLVRVEEEKIYFKEKKSLNNLKDLKEFKLIFYHFHALKFLNKKADCGNYKLTHTIKELLYYAYIKELLLIEKQLRENKAVAPLLHTLLIHGESTLAFSAIKYISNLKKKYLGTYNVFSLNNIA